jgi:hypothetical protein
MPLRLVILGTRAPGTGIQFAGNGVRDVGQLLLLLFKVLCGGRSAVLVEPLSCFLDCVEDLCITLVRALE